MRWIARKFYIGKFYDDSCDEKRRAGKRLAMTKAEAEQALAECRRRIDALDLDLRGILNRRAQVVEEVLQMKEILDAPIHEPSREQNVFRNVVAQNPGPLTAEALERIFATVIDEMRHLQQVRRRQKQEGKSG